MILANVLWNDRLVKNTKLECYLKYMWLIHNQAMSSSAKSSPKRTPIGTSTNNFSWTVWYFGLLGAKIQVFYIWRIMSHLSCHMYLHNLCWIASQQRTLLLLYCQVYTFIDSIYPEGKFESAVLDISTMGWHKYTMIIHIVPVVCTWHGCQPRHAILSKEKYQETSQMIWLCHIPWEISKDESYDLKVSYSLRNFEIRFRWFECVLILEKYRKTSHMIWTCPIH